MIGEVSGAIKETSELTHLGNSVLRQKSRAVSKEEGTSIAGRLIKILNKYRAFSGIGAGLAAPQIGLLKRVFVTVGKDEHEVYINPKMINSSVRNNYYRESCLSSRMMWGDVKRSESIEMEWVDMKGKKRQAKFTGFKARLLQHEYDHLFGVVCLDKAIPGTIEYSGNVKEEKLRNKQIND